MAIGERIHFFRLMREMTQKYLGIAVGFPKRSADVRLAQYETGTRKPNVRGKVILQSQGKDFFTWHGKDFFT